MKSTADCYRALLDGNELTHRDFANVEMNKDNLVYAGTDTEVAQDFFNYEEWSIKPKLAEHWTHITENYPYGTGIYSNKEYAERVSERIGYETIRTVLMREVPKGAKDE